MKAQDFLQVQVMAVRLTCRLSLPRSLVALHVPSATSCRHTLTSVPLCSERINTRAFSSSSVRWKEDEGADPDSGGTIGPKAFRQMLLTRRRRSLSPLERISSLLPQEALSPEVMQLRDHKEPDQHGESGNIDTSTGEQSHEQEGSEPRPLLPGENHLTYGEVLIAEHRKRRAEFKKMFKLRTGAHLQSSWGTIPHDDIAGQPSGRFVKTTQGVPIFIRRASLEDYILYMKRGPAITYPKDASVMLMMMDINGGDCVLESGSGSGAMSLFLSRSVGSQGRVLSVEVREDHHKQAVQNYRSWRASWSLRRGEEWPDNVCFHNADLRAAAALLNGRGFHAAALDMINPQQVLPTVVPHLHPGAVCAIYLANITQVVDTLDAVRCLALPLRCECIMEVPVRDWLVAPAQKKDGSYHIREARASEGEPSEEGKSAVDPPSAEELPESPEELPESPGFGRTPYIARPHPEQMSHTAFLVKLRKYVQ